MRRRQPRAIRVLAVVSVVLSAVLAVVAPDGGSASLPVAMLGALGLVVGGSIDVTLPIARGRSWRFNGLEVALAAVVLHLAGLRLWLAALVACAALFAIGRHQGRSGRSIEFAMAGIVAAAGLASSVAGAGGELGLPRPEAAALAVVVAAALRHGLAAGAVALTSGRRLFPLIRRRLLSACVHALGNAAIGLLAAELAAQAPLGLVGLLVPALLLVSGYEQQVRRAAQAELYAELARAQERAGTRSVDASAGIVSTVAARMLGGADIETLVNGRDGLVRYTGDEVGLRHRQRVDPSALDAPWVLRLLASGGVRLTREAGRPECGVSIGASASPVAFLLARRPVGAPAFSRREAALIRVLARQAAPWLTDDGSSADDAADLDGSLDATRELSRELGAVREAARRVVSSADLDRYRPDDLIGELHALERAVAQLVGTAVELAEPSAVSAAGTEASPEAPTVAAAVPRQRRPVDWTTTGKLPDPESASGGVR